MDKKRSSSLIRKVKKKLYSVLMAFLAAGMVLSNVTVPTKAVDTYVGTVSIGTQIKTNIQLEGLERPGNVWTLSINGTPALCVNHYMTTYEGAVYTRYDSSSVNPIAIKALRWYLDSTGGENNYAIAQVVAWGAVHGVYSSLDSTAAKNFLDTAMSDIIGATQWRNLKRMLELNGVTDPLAYYIDGINGKSSSTSGIYYYDNGYNQPVITTDPGYPPYEPPYRATLTSTKTASENVTVTVTKTDDTTSQPLQGVTFDFYRDDVLLKSNAVTNSNGQASASYTNTYTATSDTFSYCTNWDKISQSDKDLLSSQGVYSSQSAAQAAADAQAQQRADALANVSHTYKAVETSTRNEYYLDVSKNTVSNSITGSGNVTLTLTNHRQTGSITITKYDSETNQTVADAVYELYAAEDIVHPDGKTGTVYTNGQLVATFPATGSNGQATLNDLYLGDYTIVEKTAPDKYVVSETRYNVSLTYAGQNVSVTTASQNVSDEVQRGTIEISKNDKELYNGTQNADIVDGNDDGAQGDATLEGAVYGLYARNSITHPDGKTGTITYNSINGHINEVVLSKGTDLTVYSNSATAGTLIATAKTDKNGEIKFDHLYLGDYFIKEITPSEGYLLDETQYNVSLSYAGQTVEVTTASQDVVEQVKKQAFDLYKGGHTAGTSGNATPLEGVHFEVKLESDIQALVAQGMSLEEAKAAAPLYDELITDKNGQASSIELPYGTYRVIETVPAEDYNTADDFFVTVTEDSREHQSFTNNVIIDEVFTSYLKLVKKDAETGKTVQLANTEFKIRTLQDIYVAGKEIKAGEYVGYFTWNPFQGFWVDEWMTDESGTVMLNEMLPAGDYELVEINAPEGYLLNDEVVEFTISNKGMMEIAADGNPIITVEKEDTSVKGQITVYKEGEMLTGVQQNDDGSYSFIYEELPQSDTKFQIVADADIMDPSNDGTVLYEKDEIVETITTGRDGYAKSSELPLGAYRVEEIKVQDGMVLNKEIMKVTLEYEDQTVAVVYEKASFLNERQKIELNISKVDSDTEEPLAGAKFGLYAAEDIFDHEGTLLLEKDTLIETSVSNVNGEIIFNADLPLYKYYVKEIEAPIGYATTDEVFSIDGSYQGQNVAVIKAEKVFENDITQVQVSKKDITTQDELPNATLAIYPADAEGNPILGECFETWVSTTEPHIVKGLEINKYYVLRETVAPFDQGFVTSQDVLFYVEDTGEVQTLEMWDDVTKVEFTKTDLSTGELIGGATLAVYPVDENGNILKGECFETWLTVAGETHIIYQLPVGNYALVEEVAPFDAGYVTAEPVYFEVKDTSEIQQVVMEDDHTKVEFTKTDITTGEPVVGAQLAVIPLDENGEPKLGETFETWITDENPHLIEYLPIGDYILRETVAPFDAGYVTAEDVRFTVDNTGIVQKVEMQDDHTKVEISKLDPDGGFVEDAVLQIIPVLDDGSIDEGATFETFITDEDSHLIEYLPIGTYVLRELTAPEGYVKASDILFEVKDTADVQSVEMTNKQVMVNKVDIAGEEIEGALMKVIDEEGNVVDEWTSGKEPHAISGLVVGETYTLVEDLAPVGYVIASSIEFTVSDDGVSQHIEMVDKIVSVEKVDQDGSPLEGAVMQVVSTRTKDIVDQWVTDGNVHNIENLITGEEYILREIEAPTGYHTAEEIIFTVEDNGENQLITVTDEIKIATVHVNKVDGQTNEPILSKDFEFTLYSDSECMNEVLTVAGNTVDGYAEFELTYGVWYIKETSAPEGYLLSDEIVKVEFNDDGLFVNGEIVEAGEDGYYSIVYLNQLMPVIHIPNTGDDSHITEISLAALLSGAGMILLFLLKRRKEEMN